MTAPIFEFDQEVLFWRNGRLRRGKVIQSNRGISTLKVKSRGETVLVHQDRVTSSSRDGTTQEVIF